MSSSIKPNQRWITVYICDLLTSLFTGWRRSLNVVIRRLLRSYNPVVGDIGVGVASVVPNKLLFLSLLYLL